MILSRWSHLLSSYVYSRGHQFIPLSPYCVFFLCQFIHLWCPTLSSVCFCCHYFESQYGFAFMYEHWTWPFLTPNPKTCLDAQPFKTNRQTKKIWTCFCLFPAFTIQQLQNKNKKQVALTPHLRQFSVKWLPHQRNSRSKTLWSPADVIRLLLLTGMLLQDCILFFKWMRQYCINLYSIVIAAQVLQKYNKFDLRNDYKGTIGYVRIIFVVNEKLTNID